MTINEGAVDRVLRIFVELAITSLVFVGPKTPWAWIGLVPLPQPTCPNLSSGWIAQNAPEEPNFLYAQRSPTSANRDSLATVRWTTGPLDRGPHALADKLRRAGAGRNP